ncbi:hypothetical protein DF186_23765, partial [Enterococcus hirae]
MLTDQQWYLEAHDGTGDYHDLSHSLGVASLARTLAESRGLPREYVSLLELTGELHDLKASDAQPQSPPKFPV